MIFDYSRTEGFPTHFGPNHTPVTVDVLESGFILAAVILAVSFFISILTVEVDKTVYLYIRVTLSILLGVMIILGNFGQEWEVGEIKTHTYYKAGSGDEIYAKVGLKIGLRAINVTLKSVGEQPKKLENETINYNERFHWTWDQGIFGFGPNAGLLQKEFRKAQYRGAPLPILWTADYFVIDGEGFRYGRFYRTAGWYCHIAMWSAFPCWLLANILFRTVVKYGGYLLGIAGALQLLANFLWLVVRNPNPLVIPFNDATMRTYFGSSYWLTFSSGVICVSLFLIITICNRFCHSQLHIFFGVNPLSVTDEKYITMEEMRVDPANAEISMRNPSTIVMDREKSMLVHVKKNTNTAVRKMMMNNPSTVHVNKSAPSPSQSRDGFNYKESAPGPSRSRDGYSSNERSTLTNSYHIYEEIEDVGEESIYDTVSLLNPTMNKAGPYF